jgi:hypothetical protein
MCSLSTGPENLNGLIDEPPGFVFAEQWIGHIDRPLADANEALRANDAKGPLPAAAKEERSHESRRVRTDHREIGAGRH